MSNWNCWNWNCRLGGAKVCFPFPPATNDNLVSYWHCQSLLFYLHFPDGIWYAASVQILTCHLHTFLVRCSINVTVPLFFVAVVSRVWTQGLALPLEPCLMSTLAIVWVDCLFSYCWVWGVFCIFSITVILPFIRCVFSNIFSQSITFLFSILTASSIKQTLEFFLSTLSSMDWTFDVVSKKLLPVYSHTTLNTPDLVWKVIAKLKFI
jgi:hypothetical protein